MEFKAKVRVLYCTECGWQVVIPDGVCQNKCDRCANEGLDFMEFTMDEWTVLERHFAAVHSCRLVECP